MTEFNNLIDLLDFARETPDQNAATLAGEQSRFPCIDEVLVDLDEAFDLRGLVA